MTTLSDRITDYFENFDALSDYVKLPKELEHCTTEGKGILARPVPIHVDKLIIFLPPDKQEELSEDGKATHVWMIDASAQLRANDETVYCALVPKYSGVKIPGRKDWYYIPKADIILSTYIDVTHDWNKK